jgi:hypothetical protein
VHLHKFIVNNNAKSSQSNKIKRNDPDKNPKTKKRTAYIEFCVVVTEKQLTTKIVAKIKNKKFNIF